jgi:hypothetical protein
MLEYSVGTIPAIYLLLSSLFFLTLSLTVLYSRGREKEA